MAKLLVDGEEKEVLKQLHARRLHRNERAKLRGSIPDHVMINRGREECNSRLWNDYFYENPAYGDYISRRRFGCRRVYFFALSMEYQSITTSYRREMLSVNQDFILCKKITFAHRMLVYGTSTYITDKYIRIGESTTIECLKRFHF